MNASPPPSTRLVSLDALRGFDMFWILGADSLVVALGAISHWAPAHVLAGQLEHKDWVGFGFYDLIFPLFVFIVGVSLVFSLTQLLARETRATAVIRILRRAAILFLLGVFYNGGLTHPWPDVRLAGVLQRISLAYAAAGILFCFFKPRGLAALTAAVLVGYWALLSFVPIRDLPLDRHSIVARFPDAKLNRRGVPERAPVDALYEATSTRVTGRFDPGLNVSDHFDFRHLPGSLYDGYYDPEGILSTLPAIATCLLGVLAGLTLQRLDLSDQKKIGLLVAAGVAAIAVGWLWHLQFPVIKKIWTSSYVLVAGGWSLLLLSLFYYIVDVRRWRGWCQPFVWIGMNPITLYLTSSVFNFNGVAGRLVGGSISGWFDTHLAPGAGAIAVALAGLGLVFAFARFLYVRKIFLRV